MKLRKINKAVHRDLGYFFFGMSIIYGLSGIALNHRHHWNPNYIVSQEQYELALPAIEEYDDNKSLALYFLEQIGQQNNYRTQITRGEILRIFINGGSVDVDMRSGHAELESLRKRPVFYEVNYLHYNVPKKLWTWFSDLFAGALIILAITGLFILRGKNGITRRGAWITGAGIIIPLIMLYVYLSS